MGKDLKGKELGKGISQESTGLYSARFVDRFGKRKYKCFKKLQECRGEPKSKSGYRKIPLTEEAVAILKNQKEKNKRISEISTEWEEPDVLKRE